MRCDFQQAGKDKLPGLSKACLGLASGCPLRAAGEAGDGHLHLVSEKLAIEPRLKRWQELFLTLKAIEQDL